MDCVFCKIINKEIPGTIEGESELSLAFQNIEPVAEYHTLIVPKGHIESVMALTEGDKDVFMDMALLVQKLIKEKKIESGYKLIFNGGRYQSVPHMHWHLLAGKLEKEDDVLGKT